MPSPAPLARLDTGRLDALARSLRSGSLREWIDREAVARVLGSDSGDVADFLMAAGNEGLSKDALALVVEAVLSSKENALPDAEDLVLSGPEIPSIPTSDTATTLFKLFQQAEKEVIMAGYAFFNGREIFRPLAERMADLPGLEVVLCLDLMSKPTDTTLPVEKVKRFREKFFREQWPWPAKPRLFYYPPNLLSGPEKASMHAKSVIVDGQTALITSANFTPAAQQRNIEVGVLLRDSRQIGKVRDYLLGLIAHGKLVEIR